MVQNIHSNDTVIEKSYKINLNVTSGLEKSYRGKILDENAKELSQALKQGINIAVMMPFFRTCSVKSASLDTAGIFTFKMP